MTQVNPMPRLQHWEQVELLQYTLTQHSPFKDGYEDPKSGSYAVYNHREHRRHCGDPIAEYWHLRNGVTLWDVWVEKWVRITGPDALAFSNTLTPRDLSKCKPGQGKYVFITNENGGIINDPVLYRLGEQDFLFTAADSDLDLWAQGAKIHSGMDVRVETPDGAMVQIQGPKSPDVLAELFGEDILSIGYYWMVECEHDDRGKLVPRPGAKVWRKLRSHDGKDMDVFVARTGFSGEIGFEIGLANAKQDGVRFWKTILKAGKPHGLVQVGPGHIRRIEGGFLSYGNDIDREGNATPFAVGYGYADTWAVPESKESWYIGKEALEAERKHIKAEGLTRKLVGLEIGVEDKRKDSLGTFNDGSMTRLWPVYRREDVVFLSEDSVKLPDGSVRTPEGSVFEPDQVVSLLEEGVFCLSEGAQKVGDVTSACWSPSLERNIGLAMIEEIEYAQDGKRLVVLTEFGLYDALVVQMPFRDARKDTPKADLSGGVHAESA